MTVKTARDLRQIQHWMQSVVMHPDGVVAGIQSDAAKAMIAVLPDAIEQVVLPSKNLTSIERLAIYGNAYFARLLECLQEEFPALVHALGEETFSAFAFGYLQQYPSQSYTLGQLARDFPQYLAETRPVDASGAPSWPDFLIDLATLERTYGEVFDGPGVERDRTLQSDDLRSVPPERWPDVRLVPVPCLRLLALQYPVHEYASAVRRKQEAAMPAPATTWLIVTRRDFVIHRCAVSRPEYELLSQLVTGETIGTAIERSAQTADQEIKGLAVNLERWFRSWAAAQYFRSAELP